MSEKKDKVISSARELFSTYGYKKVSMDEIARKSGVTKKTIYTYFKDKNELLKYFVYEELENMRQLTDKIEAKELPYAEKIHEIICTLFDYKKNSKLLVAITRESEDITSKTAKECITMINNTIKETIEARLTKAIKAGDVKKCDVKLVAFIIYKFYVAVMFEWDIEEFPANKETVAETLMNILKNGLFS